MECIVAVLLMIKNAYGNTGNTDLLYVFSLFVLIFYAVKRHEKLSFILIASVPLLAVCSGMAAFYPNINVFRVGTFLCKMVLNITLMLFVAYNSKKWKMSRFTKIAVFILTVGTCIALLTHSSLLWTSEKLINGVDNINRLKLLFLNAGALSFICGFLFILLVYQLVTDEIMWKYAIYIIIVLVDIYLSYGIGGIICSLLSIALLLFIIFINKKNSITKVSRSKYAVTAGLLCVGVVGAFAINSNYLVRVKNMLIGVDDILIIKLLNPLSQIGKVFRRTNFLGVGFGNANTSYALDILGADVAYPNSFLRIIAEGGIFGVVLVLMVVILFAYISIKYGGALDKALCAFVLAYQFLGGYFTDPANFIIYGLIMGDCIRNKIAMTGSCHIKLFIPVVKEELLIGQIGHKRLYGREGGVEIVVEEISKRLVKKGHTVDAYNRSGNHVAGMEFNTSCGVKEDGINVITIPTIQKKGIAALVYSFFASIYASTKDYDVIHYHAEGPCAFIWIPSFMGIRTVATIHGLDWQRNGKWGSLASHVIKFGEKMAAEFADEIIVLSKQVQYYFKTNYNRNTNFIPNGVDRPNNLPANNIVNKWGLETRKYILLLARLTPEKGFHYAVEAFRNIDTDMKLVIAGGTSDTEAYVNRLTELAGNDDRIIFTGFVQGDDLAELYSNAYVYCLPSDLEGMPISLLEAMSYGNCCLVSDIPECTSVIGMYGRTFLQGNVTDLRKELEYLIASPEVVDEYSMKVSDYACEKYNWDDVVDKTLELYYGR